MYYAYMKTPYVHILDSIYVYYARMQLKNTCFASYINIFDIIYCECIHL